MHVVRLTFFSVASNHSTKSLRKKARKHRATKMCQKCAIYSIQYCQPGKTTPVRRVAVRESGVSRHHMGAQLRALLKPLDCHSTIVSRGLRRALNWSPIMPRNVSLWGNECNFIPVRQFSEWLIFCMRREYIGGNISLHAEFGSPKIDFAEIRLHEFLLYCFLLILVEGKNTYE